MWVRAEAFFNRPAGLLGKYGVGRDAFFLDELLDLGDGLALEIREPVASFEHTISNVFFARSLTNGMAIGGIR